MTWRRLLLVAALVAVPVAILSQGLRANPRAVPSPLVGREAPGFALPRLDGGEVQLADLRGQVVVVNFWASWCAPCREEAPALEALWQRHREAGLVLVGINIQDRDPDARAFIRATRPSYPNVVDSNGATSIAYGIYGVPETFIVDREGRIRHRQAGAVTTDALERILAPLLRKPA